MLGVHANKDYVVRFERWDDWGDTERHVHPERVRLPTPTAQDEGHGN